MDYTKITLVDKRLLCGSPLMDELERRTAVALFCHLWSIPDGPEQLAVDLASQLEVAKFRAKMLEPLDALACEPQHFQGETMSTEDACRVCLRPWGKRLPDSCWEGTLLPGVCGQCYNLDLRSAPKDGLVAVAAWTAAEPHGVKWLPVAGWFQQRTSDDGPNLARHARALVEQWRSDSTPLAREPQHPERRIDEQEG